MPPHQYSTSIQIQFVRGKKLATTNQLDDKQSERFDGFIVGALDTLRTSATGLRLLQEIDASGHSCVIFAGGDLDDNCAKPNPDDVANGLARMAINFRPFQKNLPVMIKESKVPRDLKGRPRAVSPEAAASAKEQYQQVKEKYRQVALEHGLPTTCEEGAIEFYKVLKRARTQAPAQLIRALQATNLTVSDLREILYCRRKISDAEYYRLCFYLYEYLSPGPGCSTQVRIQMKEKFYSSFKNDYKQIKTGIGKDKKAWKKLAAVILGHELVHAWRMMRGRRIVDDGYDEEIMTVGCGPFANFPLTENAIRRDLKLDTRSGYQPLSRYHSDIAAQMMSDPDAVIDAI